MASTLSRELINAISSSFGTSSEEFFDVDERLESDSEDDSIELDYSEIPAPQNQSFTSFEDAEK
jgi:hypothetical protein